MDITVIIPYNADRGYLSECLESCYSQQFSGSFEVLPYYGEQTLSKNLNAALLVAKGEFIKLIAEDDLLLPCCLQVLFDNIWKYDAVCADAINFWPDRQKPFYSSVPIDVRTLALDNTIHGATTLYRRSSLYSIAIEGKVFREDLFTGEEYELHLRMMRARMRFGYVNRFVARHRCHKDQKSIGENVNKGQYMKDRFDQIMRIKREYS